MKTKKDLDSFKETSDFPEEVGVLLSIISRNRQIFFDREAKKINIKGKYIPCLNVIHKNPGITQKEISCIFQIDKGFIARIIKELEDNDYLYKIINEDNRRQQKLFLTTKGNNILSEINEINRKWKENIFDNLTKDETEKLKKLLRVLARNSIENIRNIQ